MPTRKANAKWDGGLKEGKGHMEFGSGAFSGQYSFSSRFEEGTGTNPEELIGAAHAGCYSMAFSGVLEKEGFKPESISTEAHVRLDKVETGFKIAQVLLKTKAEVPGISQDKFQELAEKAKKGCPVSQALSAIEIKLEATLNS
jgi:lipoyl-dependent peroxiredoxin